MSRLAEMYLISAEAQGLSKGLGRLNDLRKERGLDAVNPKDEDEFIEYILDERRKELLAEGFRYYDLIRTNKAKTMLGLKDYQLVLPIPGKEMISNPNLEPNPGY
ncbi:RagB/SusD family nutrient uptake outer membrane protein [Bacteroides xylanisolvens]|nr:RagB/SusD family nutrient uptake outer membrane protein [Bacteroides xylanisolvens]